MAAKEERDHEDQHVAHVAFKIPNFWPHDPNTWFHKIESKFRICNIRQSPALAPLKTGRKRGWRHRNNPFWPPSPMRSRSTFRRWPLRSEPARKWRR